jgi:adenylosuccinate synthase
VLLDVDHGTYPYVTSSSCSSLGVPTGTGLPARQVQEVIGVAKMYTSRVGGGPHPTQLDDATGEHIRNVGNEFGTTTGRPRRCGWLDLTAVRYAAQLNGCTALCCTGLSVLGDLPGLKVCTGYRYRGEHLSSFPPDADILAEAEPIYDELEGFRGPIGDATDYDELPATAKAYINKVESFVGVPVKLVCVGPKRSQMLVR